MDVNMEASRSSHVSCSPFFFLPPSVLDLGAALRVVFSLGMVKVGGDVD
jgi:hypothetical protein